MKYIRTNWSIPYYNMAMEDYLMNEEKFDEDYVFFYIHDPSIIIGKHQNTIAEVNSRFVKENGITVARRMSGGGAVYHDHGNLNFSFVFRRRENELLDFVKYTRPVIEALKGLGVKSELSGRNDILIDGKKFSGNAQCTNKRRILSHGTLMFDVNIENMVEALNVSELKIQSKAIDSVRSRVANLKTYLDRDMSIEQFRDYLVQCFFQGGEMQEYTLSREDRNAIETRVREKFSTWEHNYGASPQFSLQKIKKFPAGLLEAGIAVENGTIIGIHFSGDFFVNEPVEILEQRLTGLSFREEAVLAREDLGGIIAGVGKKELVELLFL